MMEQLSKVMKAMLDSKKVTGVKMIQHRGRVVIFCDINR